LAVVQAYYCPGRLGHMKKCHRPSPWGDLSPYNKGMKNELSLLSNDALEALYEAYSADDCSDEQWDGLMAEMLRRDDFVASSNELAYTLECWA
jgi:hypothetical protein